MKKLLLHILSIILLVAPAYGLDVVPGLKGFGTDTRGPYAASGNPGAPWICIVDDLTATEVAENVTSPTWTAAGYSVGVYKGTLRQCVEGLDNDTGGTFDGNAVAADSGKFILFETSGTISQSGADGDNSDFQYDITGNTAIYGQTAPEPGILLRNISLVLTDITDVVIQHVRGRMAGPNSLNLNLHKSFAASAGSGETVENIVLDHISAAWGADTNVGFFPNSARTKFGEITISNSIVGEPREDVGLVGEDDETAKNVMLSRCTETAFFRNLVSNGGWRNPQVSNCNAFVANNYSYNHTEFGYDLAGGAATIVSYVNNILKGGAMSQALSDERMPNFKATFEDPLTNHHIYLYGNITDAGTQSSSTDWLSPGFQVDVRPGLAGANVYADVITNETFNLRDTGETPSTDASIYPTDHVLLETLEVKAHIIDNAGAYPAFRDSVDLRIIDEMENDTGPSAIITGAPSAGDWPVLTVNTTTLAIPSSPHSDSGDGYTNLEKWVHRLADIVEGVNFISSASPADNATGVAIGAALTWTNPGTANDVDVYFEEISGSCDLQVGDRVVNDTDVETYDPPGDLTVSTEYCWRVDVNHAGGTETGVEYSFTTTSGPPVDPTKKAGLVYSIDGGEIKYSSSGMLIK